MFVDDLEKLIVSLTVLRARLLPRISYPRAEAMSAATRMPLMSVLYEDPSPAIITPVLVEAAALLAREAKSCLRPAIING